MNHYKRLGPVEVLETMAHFCALEERLADKSGVWKVYSAAMSPKMVEGRRILSALKVEDVSAFWPLCEEEYRYFGALEHIIDGYIAYCPNRTSETIKTLREIRNQFVPDGERVKVQRFAADAPALAKELRRQLERYAEFMSKCQSFDDHTLLSVVENYITALENKDRWLSQRTAEVRRACIELERFWQDALPLLNRAYGAMCDEMKALGVLPTAFTHAFSKGEDLEIHIDIERRHAGERD